MLFEGDDEFASNNGSSHNGRKDEKNHQHTIVDRTVVPLVPNPDQTPSLLDGISVQQERLQRLHGCFLLRDACTLLKQSPCAFATSCAMLHRFYHRISLTKKDVWSVCMACTVLAGKVQEEPRPIRHVIVIYNHLYRRRRLCIQSLDENGTIIQQGASSSFATKLSSPDEKLNMLRFTPPMSPQGPIYQEYQEALMETEHLVLQQLGFVLYWIPDSHPHQYLLYMIRALSVDKEKELARKAWNYCNTSCLLDLSTRFSPELIACATIHLAAVDLNIALPTNIQTSNQKTFAWWQVFVGNDQEDDWILVCNAILGLSADKKSNDMLVAATTFVPSLVEGGSFNDPDSFIWSQAD